MAMQAGELIKNKKKKRKKEECSWVVEAHVFKRAEVNLVYRANFRTARAIQRKLSQRELQLERQRHRERMLKSMTY